MSRHRLPQASTSSNGNSLQPSPSAALDALIARDQMLNGGGGDSFERRNSVHFADDREDEFETRELLKQSATFLRAGANNGGNLVGGVAKRNLFSSPSSSSSRHSPVRGTVRFGPVGGPSVELARERTMSELNTEKNRSIQTVPPLRAPNVDILHGTPPAIAFTKQKQFEPALPWASITPVTREAEKVKLKLAPVRVPRLRDVVQNARQPGLDKFKQRKRAAKAYQQANPDIFGTPSRCSYTAEEFKLSKFASGVGGHDTQLEDEERRVKAEIAEFAAQEKRKADIVNREAEKQARGGRRLLERALQEEGVELAPELCDHLGLDRGKVASGDERRRARRERRDLKRSKGIGGGGGGSGRKLHFNGKQLTREEREAYLIAGIISEDDIHGDAGGSRQRHGVSGHAFLDSDSDDDFGGGSSDDDADSQNLATSPAAAHKSLSRWRRAAAAASASASTPLGTRRRGQTIDNDDLFSATSPNSGGQTTPRRQMSRRSPLKSRTPGVSIPRAQRTFITENSFSGASPNRTTSTSGKFLSPLHNRRAQQEEKNRCTRDHDRVIQRAYADPPANPLGRVGGRKSDTEHAKLHRLAERLLTREHLEKTIRKSIEDEDSNAWFRDFAADVEAVEPDEGSHHHHPKNSEVAKTRSTRKRSAMFDGGDPEDDLRAHGILASPEHLHRMAAKQLREDIDLKRDDCELRRIKYSAVDKNPRGLPSLFFGSDRNPGNVKDMCASDPFQWKATKWDKK